MNSIQIIPVILATSEEEYREKVEKISQSPELKDGWVQIDLADGKFASNTTVGLDILKKYPLSLHKEAHLMVEDPGSWIDGLKELGFKRVIFHLEAGNTEKFIEQIKLAGMEVGLAINPQTPVAKLTPFIDKIEVVLILSVNPGFGGQTFIRQTLDKVQEAVKLRQENSVIIEVDGGITAEVAKELGEAGADNLVIGEHLINGDIGQNLETIWQSIHS